MTHTGTFHQHNDGNPELIQHLAPMMAVLIVGMPHKKKKVINCAQEVGPPYLNSQRSPKCLTSPSPSTIHIIYSPPSLLPETYPVNIFGYPSLLHHSPNRGTTLWVLLPSWSFKALRKCSKDSLLVLEICCWRDSVWMEWYEWMGGWGRFVAFWWGDFWGIWFFVGVILRWKRIKESIKESMRMRFSVESIEIWSSASRISYNTWSLTVTTFEIAVPKMSSNSRITVLWKVPLSLTHLGGWQAPC